MKNCKDCTERFVGCHSSCPDYAARREKSEKLRREKLEHRLQSEDVRAATAVVRRRGMKRRKG